MFHNILLAYDGSDNGRRALETACEFSKKLGADLKIVHVLMHGRPPQELVRMAEVEHLVKQVQTSPSLQLVLPDGRPAEMLRQGALDGGSARVISALGDQLVANAKERCKTLGAQNVTGSVRLGDHAEEILDAANEAGADMIVIGSRGLGKIRSAVLGSVSQKIIHNATQTVVVVK